VNDGDDSFVFFFFPFFGLFFGPFCHFGNFAREKFLNFANFK
jgi:hypothetical protein